MTRLPNSPRHQKGVIVGLDPANPLVSSIVFQITQMRSRECWRRKRPEAKWMRARLCVRRSSSKVESSWQGIEKEAKHHQVNEHINSLCIAWRAKYLKGETKYGHEKDPKNDRGGFASRSADGHHEKAIY